jgi:hypothetical protein
MANSQSSKNSERLGVSFEPITIAEIFRDVSVELFLGDVAKRRMSQVVRKTGRLDGLGI